MVLCYYSMHHFCHLPMVMLLLTPQILLGCVDVVSVFSSQKKKLEENLSSPFQEAQYSKSEFRSLLF